MWLPASRRAGPPRHAAQAVEDGARRLPGKRGLTRSTSVATERDYACSRPIVTSKYLEHFKVRTSLANPHLRHSSCNNYCYIGGAHGGTTADNMQNKTLPLRTASTLYVGFATHRLPRWTKPGHRRFESSTSCWQNQERSSSARHAERTSIVNSSMMAALP